MKNLLVVLVLALTGCETMDRIIQPRVLTPEERAAQSYQGQLGAALLMNSGYSTTPRTFGEILGASALGVPLEPVKPLAPPVQTNCVVYPPNPVTGQQQVVCH
jgi:hypothetical protein